MRRIQDSVTKCLEECLVGNRGEVQSSLCAGSALNFSACFTERVVSGLDPGISHTSLWVSSFSGSLSQVSTVVFLHLEQTGSLVRTSCPASRPSTAARCLSFPHPALVPSLCLAHCWAVVQTQCGPQTLGCLLRAPTPVGIQTSLQTVTAQNGQG